MRFFTRIGAFLLAASLLSTPVLAQTNLRGGNIDGLTFDENLDLPFIQRMKEQGASGVRLFFLNENATTHDETEYRAWLQNTVYPRMSQLVDLFANQLGMHVLLSIHIAPGGRVPDSSPPVDRALIPGAENEWMRNVLVDAWTYIATQYNSMGDKVSYQIYSEPAPPSDKSAWRDLQARIINAIRDVPGVAEAEQPRVYFMTEFGTPSKVSSVNVSALRGRGGIIGNPYHPFDYTHQNTPSAKKANNFKYPGCKVVGASGGKKKKKVTSFNRTCNYAGIEKSLKQFVRFAKKHNLEKLAAEFAVSRLAQGAAKYLKDLLRALKKQKMGWFYYTFVERGDSPWRLDCTDESGATCIPAPLNEPSSRQRELEKSLNQLLP